MTLDTIINLSSPFSQVAKRKSIRFTEPKENKKQLKCAVLELL